VHPFDGGEDVGAVAPHDLHRWEEAFAEGTLEEGLSEERLFPGLALQCVAC
jgi:hypothetical protein